jgi:hypothetical protein
MMGENQMCQFFIYFNITCCHMKISIFICKTTVSAFLCIIYTNSVICEVIIDVGICRSKAIYELVVFICERNDLFSWTSKLTGSSLSIICEVLDGLSSLHHWCSICHPEIFLPIGWFSQYCGNILCVNVWGFYNLWLQKSKDNTLLSIGLIHKWSYCVYTIIAWSSLSNS